MTTTRFDLRMAPLALIALLAAGCGAHRGAATAVTHPADTPSTREERIAAARLEAAAAPAEPYWHWRVASLWLEADRPAPAIAALDSALTRDPSYAPAATLRARLHWDAGEHAEAVTLLQAALDRPGAFPDGPPAELVAALALHEAALGHGERAAARLAALSNRDGAVRTVEAYLLLRGETPAAADEAIAKALDGDGGSAPNHNNAGIAKLRAGDADGAEQSFRRAIEIDPKLPGPYYNLALLEKFWRFDDAAAAQWFRAYRERASEDPDRLAEVLGETPPVASGDRE